MDEIISKVIHAHSQLLGTHPSQFNHFINDFSIIQIYMIILRLHIPFSLQYLCLDI